MEAGGLLSTSHVSVTDSPSDRIFSQDLLAEDLLDDLLAQGLPLLLYLTAGSPSQPPEAG